MRIVKFGMIQTKQFGGCLLFYFFGSMNFRNEYRFIFSWKWIELFFLSRNDSINHTSSNWNEENLGYEDFFIHASLKKDFSIGQQNQTIYFKNRLKIIIEELTAKRIRDHDFHISIGRNRRDLAHTPWLPLSKACGFFKPVLLETYRLTA